MKLLLTIILGVLLFTFAWGWIMDVHYGYMSTDKYIHSYLLNIQDFFEVVINKAHKNIDFFFNPNQPLIRREFALPTV